MFSCPLQRNPGRVFGARSGYGNSTTRGPHQASWWCTTTRRSDQIAIRESRCRADACARRVDTRTLSQLHVAAVLQNKPSANRTAVRRMSTPCVACRPRPERAGQQQREKAMWSCRSGAATRARHEQLAAPPHAPRKEPALGVHDPLRTPSATVSETAPLFRCLPRASTLPVGRAARVLPKTSLESVLQCESGRIARHFAGGELWLIAWAL
jgi:hypothetical protein